MGGASSTHVPVQGHVAPGFESVKKMFEVKQILNDFNFQTFHVHDNNDTFDYFIHGLTFL